MAPADPTGDEHIDVFDLTEWGVNVALSLIRRPPGMWTEVQNGQPSYTFGARGIEKRGGLTPLNGTALAGPVMAFGDVPLGSPFDVGITDRLIAGLREDTPLAGAFYVASTSGAGWAGYGSVVQPSVGWLKAGAREESMIWTSQNAGAIKLQRWNGSTLYQLLASFPQAVNGKVYVSLYTNGSLFFVVNAVASPGSSDVYYVYEFAPQSGVIQQIGGATLTHGLLGTPVALSFAGGILRVAGKGNSNAAGVVYKYGATGWALDRGPDARAYYGGYDTTQVGVDINGRFCFSLSGDGSAIPGTVLQCLNGAYSTLFTCPNNDESVRGLANHNGVLLEAVMASAGGVYPANTAARIYADGVQEVNVLTTFGATSCQPGDAVVYSDGSLYWAWFRPSSVLLQGFILKRTAAGVWSQVDSGRALNGFLGMVGV